MDTLHAEHPRVWTPQRETHFGDQRLLKLRLRFSASVQFDFLPRLSVLFFKKKD